MILPGILEQKSQQQSQQFKPQIESDNPIAFFWEDILAPDLINNYVLKENVKENSYSQTTNSGYTGTFISGVNIDELELDYQSFLDAINALDWTYEILFEVASVDTFTQADSYTGDYPAPQVNNAGIKFNEVGISTGPLDVAFSSDRTGILTHAVFTYSDTERKLFLEGSLENTGTSSSFTYDSYLFRPRDTKIYAIAIYDKILTDQQISDHFNSI